MATSSRATVFFCHGSRNPAWRAPFEKLLQAYRRAHPDRPARLAFLELMAPSLPEVLAELAQAGCLDIEIHPLFLAAGSHTTGDLPALVDEARAARPQLKAKVMPALLESPAVRAALVAALAPRQAGAITRRYKNTPTKSLAVEVDGAILHRMERKTKHPGYAGDVAPGEAWQLVQSGDATLVDVRTAEELHWVGRVPGAVHVEWASGRDQVRNEHFLDQLAAKVPKDQKVLFLCRSGARSASAAKAATGAGYRSAWNVSQGFEGPLDAQKQRGRIGGWRAAGLPWLQS